MAESEREWIDRVTRECMEPYAEACARQKVLGRDLEGARWTENRRRAELEAATSATKQAELAFYAQAGAVRVARVAAFSRLEQILAAGHPAQTDSGAARSGPGDA